MQKVQTRKDINLLIAEDEKNIRQVLVNELASEGVRISEAETGTRALELLQQDEFDVLLLDLNMPGMNGIELLKEIREKDIPTEVIVLTANSTAGTAVEAMKLGAYDYFTKPFRLDQLSAVIEKACEKKRLKNENILLKSKVLRQAESSTVVTGSAVMRELLEKARKLAESDFPVLIQGESGAGKELIARAIHDASIAVDGSFVPINCGAMPQNMIESELFGHEKGAFTGAVSKKPGLLEIADEGTLFLDEIGDMPPAVQVRLLRVIETKRFFRVGGTRERRVRVRFLSATNKDLKKETEQGRFREDLFYRIAALTVHVPPLRDRPDDIPLLVEHFLRGFSAGRHRRFSLEAMRSLASYSWPGNVRELQNVVQRALLLTKGEIIESSDLPSDITGNGRTATLRLEDAEREHILKVLKLSGGQRGRTAEALGIDPKTLYRKLMSYGVKID